MKSCYVPLIALSLLCWSSGCSENNSEESPQLETQSSADSASPVSSNTSSPPKAPNYTEIFDAIVRGWAPDATNAEQKTMDEAYGTIENFNEQQLRDFIGFMIPKLQSSDPYVRIQAASEIANFRIHDLGEGKKNKDLVPVYVKLLNEKQDLVRSFSLNSMELLVQKSGLGEELLPLIQPLIQNLEQPRTTYQSIKLLGDIGPSASKAIPFIRKAAARDKDKIIDELSAKAIQKIEAGKK